MPDTNQVLQRYSGFYSSRQRAERRKANGDGLAQPLEIVELGSKHSVSLDSHRKPRTAAAQRLEADEEAKASLRDHVRNLRSG
jgi:hypothetical protein